LKNGKGSSMIDTDGQTDKKRHTNAHTQRQTDRQKDRKTGVVADVEEWQRQRYD
jgi:hypothetical protein